MVCKHCETENPEGAVFCMHCGKRLDGKIVCSSCGHLCPEEALFCNMCGKRLNKDDNKVATESEQPAVVQSEPIAEHKVQPTPKDKSAQAAKVKKALDLSGGISLMVGVLFALVFVLCMGLSATVDSYSSPKSESTIIWDFFGSEYEDMREIFDKQKLSDYAQGSYLIPTILSTIVCAGSLICVLAFTVVSAILYGKHFKNSQIKYAKYAIAAILSFVLGAAAFLAVNYAVNGGSSVSVTFSDATLAGIILCSIFLGSYYILKNVALGKEFIKKQTIVDFVSTTCAVLFLILTAVFAVLPAVSMGIKGYAKDADINFMGLNALICELFDVRRTVPDNFTETYVLSILAQAAGIVLIVLAFVTMIQKLSVYREKPGGCLGFSIALFSVSAVYLVFTCLSLHFGNELIKTVSTTSTLSIAAAPIVAVIMSAFLLATSITHKIMLKKTAEQ